MGQIRMHGQGPRQTPFQTNSTPFYFPRVPDSFSQRLMGGGDSLLWMHFPVLSIQERLFHGVLSRHGGVSKSPFHSLNISYQVDDCPQDVSRNLYKIQVSTQAEQIMFMDQRHGDEVLVFSKGRVEPPGNGLPADAMVTDVPGIALIVKQADCQGVIIYDPNRHVVANVHCGWRGSVLNILGKVVSVMNEEFGCSPRDLLSAIGPSLGPCCAEFKDYKDMFPEYFLEFMVRESHFDLWAISCRQLVDAGLQENNIELARICTSCRKDLFFSHRAEGVTGRFGTVAMLRSPQHFT